MGELGSRLVRAREARGLTIEDAERDTRISRRYLQALEAEQFDVIPAPVYARGFLRSYSQYLGLNAQDLLTLFPRDDDAPYSRPSPQDAQQRKPTPMRPAAKAPPRPVWRQDSEPVIGRGSAAPAAATVPQVQRVKRPAPVAAPQQEKRKAPRPAARAVPEEPYEPTIGIDIGVPVPARRLQDNPAGTTRSAAIVVVAIVAVVVVILLAFIISRLGKDDSPAGSTGDRLAPANQLTPGTNASPVVTIATGRSGLPVTPGVVPAVIGGIL